MQTKTGEQGYQDGLRSGARVPREPDDFDAVHAANVGGTDYAEGFIRGVRDGSDGSTAGL